MARLPARLLLSVITDPERHAVMAAPSGTGPPPPFFLLSDRQDRLWIVFRYSQRGRENGLNH